MSHAKPMAFDVVDTGEVALQTHTACVVGDDFAINADLLTRAIAQPLEPIDHDVLLVIAAVCLVDRSVRRTNGTGWCRRLSIRVPVLKLHTWQHARTSLETLLARLTGDAWSFEFRQRRHIPEAQGHFEIDQDHLQGSIVVPYSEGLDSFAAVAMLRVENPDAKVLLLNVRPSKKASKQLFRSSPTQTIGIPVTFTQKDHRELSYRTRTFQYFGVAALVWHKTKASKIVIGESGIGCLGPGLVPVGVEQPVRGNSPVFIADLKEFFHQLWDRTPVFEFLNLWRTKAMALAKSKPNLGGWQRTTSRSRMVRRQHPGATARQCGLCSGCVFRRMSVLSAGSHSNNCTFTIVPRTYWFSCRVARVGQTYCLRQWHVVHRSSQTM